MAHVWLWHKPRLSNPQSSKTAGAAHSGCSARWVWSSKMADSFTTASMWDGKLCRSYNLQSPANPRCSKTAGPVYSAQLPFVSVRAAVVTPGTTGRRRFLMSHFYSGDKVSYPWRLKRPWGALEWQLCDARQTQRDTGGRGGTWHRCREEKWRCKKFIIKKTWGKFGRRKKKPQGIKDKLDFKRDFPPVCRPVSLPA